MRFNEFARLDEKWSQKYKSSINCSHPKGFSQKAHCAGKKKHNESHEVMEHVCPDCGMCQTHGDMSLNEIKKGQKDSNGFSSCWKGYHAAGTKKGKNGGRVRNCVPNESINESEDKRCMQCGMKNCPCPGDTCKCKPIAGWEPGKGFKKAIDEAANAAAQAAIAIKKKESGKYSKKDGHRLKEGYGRYWCSTDKKWKTRQGPKQTRSVEEGSLADAAKHVKKGALHKQEGIPKDKKIGTAKLKSLKANGTPLEKKRANFALNIQGKS
jgi:hypothetical protein